MYTFTHTYISTCVHNMCTFTQIIITHIYQGKYRKGKDRKIQDSKGE